MKYLLALVALGSLVAGSVWYVWVAAFYTSFNSPSAVALTLGPSIVSLLLLVVCSDSLVPLLLRRPVPGRKVGGRLLLSSIAAYAALVPAFWVLAGLIVGHWENPEHPEAEEFVILLTALYLPPWWAPLFGAIAAWLWVRYGSNLDATPHAA